jgi:predicted transposase YdaD
MPGIRNMRDSSTYQAIMEEGRAEGRVEGRAEGERRAILRIGAVRFGEPDNGTRARLDAIVDVDVLERLATRLLTVSSWAELLED